MFTGLHCRHLQRCSYLQRRFLPDSEESATLEDSPEQGNDSDDGDSDDDSQYMTDTGADDDVSLASLDDNSSTASQEGTLCCHVPMQSPMHIPTLSVSCCRLPTHGFYQCRGNKSKAPVPS